MASFKCTDIGMKCDFEVKDESRDELTTMIALHGEKTHNMKQTPPDMMAKIERAIKK